jgi:colicin import membrane protein
VAADAPAGDAQAADWAARMERAVALQREGSERKAEAERVFEKAGTECYQKFLVNRCRANARTEYREEVKEARRIENEGKAIERQVKKEQLNARDREAEALAPQRAAELQAREAETAAARSSAAALEAEKRADQARKAEEGARR